MANIYEQLRSASTGDHARRSIKNSHEFRRISSLPRRTSFHDLTEAMTEWLKQPNGTMKLRREQAWALMEFHDSRGLVGNIGVGGGKTLVTMLAPNVVGAERPLLIVPATLRDKTLRTDVPNLAQHWKLHPNMRVISYETLSQEKQATYLVDYQPDLIVADECHHLRNFRSASVARRVARYLEEYGQFCMFMGLSGTITKRSLRDYAHLMYWALRDRSPLPTTQSELDDWADLLDERLSQRDGRADRPDVGAMSEWLQPGENPRDGFRRRLLETPGFVFTESPLVLSSNGANCSISILEFEVDPPPEVVAAFRHLRSTWETPLGLARAAGTAGSAGSPGAIGVIGGGEVISDALTFYRHANELAMGFFYRWKWPNDTPDKEWLEARRNWKTFVRKTIMRSLRDDRRGSWSGSGDNAGTVGSVAGAGVYDSEKQVARACISGRLVPPNNEYEKWRVIAHDRKRIWGQAEPPKETVWVSEFMIDAGMKYLQDHPKGAVIWVDQVAVLEKFRERGALVFGGGDEGVVAEGKLGGRAKSCVLSLDSHGEGKNLQAYNRALFYAVPKSGVVFEQAIGRLHRAGQPADEVRCEVTLHTIELWKSFDQARKDAAYIEQTTAQKQRLGLADIVVTSSDVIDNLQRSNDLDVRAMWAEEWADKGVLEQMLAAPDGAATTPQHSAGV